ncbi:MAG: PF20097 family protein [Lachnospiraceae bacterium]|nr:PF20097 family protein [Lachnospiraceae bacterium]
MNCPFCEQEMIPGMMTGDGRSVVRWAPLDDKLSFVDKIVGKGIVTGATYKLGFKI